MTTKNSPTKILLRDKNGKFVGSGSKTAIQATNLHSSFIQSLKIEGSNVNVVMSRSPKTVYTYKPTQDGLNEVKKVLTQGGSLGTVYNKHLKGHELSRTIYKN
jgi:hypothetical protein